MEGKPEEITVYLHDSENSGTLVTVNENSTAQEVLRQIAYNTGMIKENQLNEYALFIKLDQIEAQALRERMLSSHECPLKIQRKVILDSKFRFIAKKCLMTQAPIEDSVMAEENLTETRIREGVLQKMSKGNWVDRYIKLDEKCIYYGKDKKTIAKAFTRIDLETVSVQEASDKGKYCFQLIISQHNKYIFKVNNTQNKEKWMQSISNQCSIVRENREFENINKKIRAEENKRAANDEKLVMDCHDPEKLINADEGVRLLIELEEDEKLRNCLNSVMDYKSYKNRPSVALVKAEGKGYLEIIGLIEGASSNDLFVFKPELINMKNKRLSEFKRQKSMHDQLRNDVDLYKELFVDFINNYRIQKSEVLNKDQEYFGKVLDKLHELPLNRWKSKLKQFK